MINLKHLAKFGRDNEGLPIASILMGKAEDTLLSSVEVTDLLGEETGSRLLELVITDPEYIKLSIPVGMDKSSGLRPAHEVLVDKIKHRQRYREDSVDHLFRFSRMEKLSIMLEILRDMIIPVDKLGWVIDELKNFDHPNNIEIGATIEVLQQRQQS